MKWSVSAAGSLAVAMMSRSRTVSLRRRALPASETRSEAGCSRSSSTASSSAGSARPRSVRGGPEAFFLRPTDLRMFSSSFAPSPGSVRRRCSRAAVFSSASVVTPSSCQILRTVFGPSPGMWRNSTTSGGIVLRRLVSASISPLSTIWTILSWIVAPIPGSSLALPSSASWATGPPVSRTRVAALR